MIFKKVSTNRILVYVGVSILSILILVWVMKLWQADLNVPFAYGGDALLNGMTIKGLIDNGSHLYNSFIGMPAGAIMYDFTGSDNFHMLVIRAISPFTSDWALVMNIYFLLVFPLTTLCSMFVFRQFGFSYFTSLAASLLYTFLPYRFLRGEGHLFLGAHYIVPLMVMVILWVFSGQIRLFHSNEQPKYRRVNGKLIASIIISLITASSGVYYVFFACIFLFVAGIKVFFKQRNSNSLLVPVFLIFIIFTGVLINLSPTLIYQYRNGRNVAVAKRSPMETEVYGLKVTHLLLPTAGHRISELAKIKHIYSSTTPLNNENISSSLGMIGSMGFLILIGALFFWGAPFLKSEIVEHLSLLNIAGVLYTTIGGFGSLFACIYPQFRALNRISVFIAFFSFFAVLIILERVRGYFKSLLPRVLFCCFVCAVTIFGILDQTSESFVPPYDLHKSEYTSDHNFITRIENSVPQGSMIFQLPYMWFPEYGVLNRMGDYDHFKGYLHSKTLRWSYGAMKGRKGDDLIRWVSSKPLSGLVRIISLAGFNGIYVDRYGYRDNGAELENKLKTLLNTSPIVSSNKRLLFFDLRGFARTFDGEPQNEVKSTVPGSRKLQQSLLPAVTNNIACHIDILREGQNYIEILGWAYINEKSSENSKMYLGLISDKNSYRIETSLMKRPDVTAYFGSLNFDDSGFFAIVAKEEMEPGTYEAGIYIKRGDAEAFQYIGRTIRIEK